MIECPHKIDNGIRGPYICWDCARAYARESLEEMKKECIAKTWDYMKREGSKAHAEGLQATIRQVEVKIP